MKVLLIDKSIDGAPQETIKVPIFVLKILLKILPAKGNSLLADMSFDIGEIIEACGIGSKFIKTINVTEKGVEKKVVLSVK